MARTRRVVPVSEKIEAKKAEIAKVEEKLAKLQNELKELQTKADAEKKCSATRGVRKRCPYEKTVSTCDKHKSLGTKCGSGAIFCALRGARF